MRIASALATLSFFVAAPAFATPTSYTFDPAHSAATFSVKHLGISTVRGEFGTIRGRSSSIAATCTPPKWT